MAHADDFEIAPVLICSFKIPSKSDPGSLLWRGYLLLMMKKRKMYHGHAYAPPADYEPRNITSWVSANMTIGTASFNQSVVGGFSKDASSFSPSVVQWLRPDHSVGYLNLYPTETALRAEVAPYALNLTYPLGNASSTFTFLLAANPLGTKRDVTSLADIDGVKVVVGGSVDPVPEISFCGLVGVACDVHDSGFVFWNVTFSMPVDSSEIPRIGFSWGLSLSRGKSFYMP
ncbi:hypothetical protein BJX70DRAFT_398171 [Aspergillus crustosus]